MVSVRPVDQSENPDRAWGFSSHVSHSLTQAPTLPLPLPLSSSLSFFLSLPPLSHLHLSILHQSTSQPGPVIHPIHPSSWIVDPPVRLHSRFSSIGFSPLPLIDRNVLVPDHASFSLLPPFPVVFRRRFDRVSHLCDS